MVREDLPPPQQAVQACHAVLEAARQGLIPDDIEHPHLVMCALPNEERLDDFFDSVHYAGIKYACFTEPDLGDSHTAFCTEPLYGDSRKTFRSLKLATLTQGVSRDHD